LSHEDFKLNPTVTKLNITVFDRFYNSLYVAPIFFSAHTTPFLRIVKSYTERVTSSTGFSIVHVSVANFNPTAGVQPRCRMNLAEVVIEQNGFQDSRRLTASVDF
jgi:hypothetical protein